MSVILIDISSYQGKPDFNAVRSAGIGAVVIKATEGTGYVNPYFAADRDAARAVGLALGFYHFADATDAVAEANHFCDVVGSLQPGDFVALDWEVAGSDPAGWSLAFVKQVEARLGVKPLIYMNKSTEAAINWSPLVANNNGLWLANYDFDANNAAPVSVHWPFVAIEQYSDKGVVPGVAGGVDCDVFYGDLATLAKYGYAGQAPAPVPAPAPTPPPPPPAPVFDVRNWRANFGDKGQVFVNLQNWGNRCFPAYCRISPTSPSYGPQTAAFVREFAHRCGIWSADGLNIGPQIANALYNNGFRG